MHALLLTLVFGSSALADSRLAPPDFDLRDGGGRAVFVHFDAAKYEVTFDIAEKRARISSFIRFTNRSEGMPVFDLIDEPASVVVDGEKATQELIEAPGSRPRQRIAFRIVKKKLAPGPHMLEIEHELKAYPARFGPGKVQSGFFMWDFDARGLLERYLPANLEYDQVPMRMDVRLKGATREHLLFTNGRADRLARDSWSIEFPKHFNCSALYFHVRPRSETTVLRYDFHSRDGRKIPVVVYEDKRLLRQDLKPFKELLDEKVKAYEARFGPFPHPSLIVYNTGTSKGAMEYSGAAFTNLEALPHELAHSYFGRGVMPANGNAGWIDEAMATYVGGPDTGATGVLEPKNMAGHSPYFRGNDSLGYTYGVNLLLNIDRRLAGKKDLTFNMDGFLKSWVDARLRQVTSTPILKQELERYAGQSFSDLFGRFVYGLADYSLEKRPVEPMIASPHPPMTADELYWAQ